MSKWSDEQARQIGKAIKALRGDRTGQWLADRTAELGHAISRTTISELESDDGRRKHVTTAELCVLAAALNTAPIALLYPGPYGQQVEVLPGVDWPQQIQAVQWFSGIQQHGWTDRVSGPGEPAGGGGRESAQMRNEYRSNIGGLTQWRELLDLYQERSDMRQPRSEDENDVKVYRLLLRSINTRINSLRLALNLLSIDDFEDEDGG